MWIDSSPLVFLYIFSDEEKKVQIHEVEDGSERLEPSWKEDRAARGKGDTVGHPEH